MPVNSSSNLKSVIDLFTPDVLGAFWITDEELTTNLLGLDEFNYLFDGLISQYLYAQDPDKKRESNRADVFFTQNFGKKIFLSHIKNTGNIANVIDEQIAIVQESASERKKILVFNTSSKDWISELKKNYPKFEFMPLELSKIGK